MIFYNGEAKLLFDGKPCDEKGGHCDPYIKISLNGDVEYVSQCRTNSYAPQFNLRYSSPVLRNSTVLKIEMFDDGAEQGYEDSLMERWVFQPVNRIAGLKRLEGSHWPERRGSLNKIFIDAYWTWMEDYIPSQ